MASREPQLVHSIQLCGPSTLTKHRHAHTTGPQLTHLTWATAQAIGSGVHAIIAPAIVMACM